MVITSEYVLNNPKLDEIGNINKNTEREHNDKYGFDQKKNKIEVMCDVEFIDELKNKTRIVKINHYYIRYRISKRECASNNKYTVNKVIKLIIILEKEISKLVINTYLKRHIPMLWRNFFFNIANDGEFINNYCIYSHSK